MDPPRVLPYIGHYQKVWVKAPLFKTPPEGRFMHARGASGHHNSVQSALPYGFLDELLTGFRTHILIS